MAKKNIVVLHPPFWDILIPSRLDAFVEQSQSNIHDRVTHPVVIHSFSNGGFILLTMLLAADHRAGSRLSSKLENFVLDSAPAPVNPDMTARALLSVILGTVDPVASPMFLPLRLLCGLYLKVPIIKQRHADLWQFWKKQAPIRPILCMLSKKDPLIDIKAANRFLDEQVIVTLLLLPVMIMGHFCHKPSQLAPQYLWSCGGLGTTPF